MFSYCLSKKYRMNDEKRQFPDSVIFMKAPGRTHTLMTELINSQWFIKKNDIGLYDHSQNDTAWQTLTAHGTKNCVYSGLISTADEYTFGECGINLKYKHLAFFGEIGQIPTLKGN